MSIKKFLNFLSINYFLYEIVHHCNLRCKGCDHLAPIANEEFVDLNTFKNDLILMKKRFFIIKSVGIMGGEPLLHPNLLSMLLIARKILKNTKIYLFTNGILLSSLNSDVWNVLRKEKIILVVTKYKTI